LINKFILKPATLACLVFGILAGCGASLDVDKNGLYATPIGSAPVTNNTTPYSEVLDCLSVNLPHVNLPRIAVGDITDFTGKSSDAEGGRRVTQGASLMAMSAIDRVGLHLVERLNTAVATDELKLANNNLIGDGGEIRSIKPASIVGSDYILLGGITELNYNIGSVARDAYIGSASVTSQFYVMNLAIDLRLVNTKSLQVVDVASYQKQIIGREVRAGVFEFFGDQLFDLSMAERALEPLQMAVRAMIEHAVGEMTRNLLEIEPGVCVSRLEGSEAPSNTLEEIK
jgi:curli biogenesis system outer membrane secretion channel CsgG